MQQRIYVIEFIINTTHIVMQHNTQFVDSTEYSLQKEYSNT